MDRAASIVCKAFLHKCDPQKREALMHYLPISEKNLIESLPLTYADPSEGFETLPSLLQTVHFTWFSFFLRTLPEKEIRLFIACLNEAQARGLKKMMHLSNSLPELPHLARHFLEQLLYEALLEEEKRPLPIACLPVGPLNQLLELEETQWDELIGFLGLHDVAAELPFIIETSQLKKIYGCLDEKDLAYLKILTHRKETILFRRMGLDKWDGNTENLKHMIQQRGINRLAKALYIQDPDLIWHIRHRMDIEQAALLKKFCAPLEHPKAAGVLVEQVKELVSQIQQKH